MSLAFFTRLVLFNKNVDTYLSASVSWEAVNTLDLDVTGYEK